MTVFYVEIIVAFFSSLVARMSYDKKYRFMAMFYGTLTAIILVAVAGFGKGFGDAGMYKHTFELLVKNPNSADLSRDAGWAIFNLLLIQISSEPQILLLVNALIINCFNYIVFYKYQSYLELQVYLYITSGYYLVTMNGMRQSLAAALLFMCTKYIVNGKFVKLLIATIFISTIHASALIMIPAYYIIRQEAWSKRIIQLIALAIVGVILYDLLSPILFKLLEGTQYSNYSEFDEGGSSIIRTIINIVPVALAYIKREELKKAWPESNIFVNIAVINAVFVAFGMANWIFNRFTVYFQLYNFVLLPYIIRHCLKGKERRLFYLGIIACYFIFMYFEQVVGLGINYKSDYLDFNKLIYK